MGERGSWFTATRPGQQRPAELHECTLPDDDANGKQEHVTFASYKLLEDRLETAEDALRACELITSVAQEELKEAQERFTQIEQQVGGLAQWATRQERLPVWMTQIETH